MAGSVGGTAVYLAGVLAREGATTVGSLATIGIDNDFTTRQAGIAMRATDDKLAGGVDEVFDVATEQRQHTG